MYVDITTPIHRTFLIKYLFCILHFGESEINGFRESLIWPHKMSVELIVDAYVDLT